MLARFLRGVIIGVTMIAAVSASAPPASAAGGCLPPSKAPRGLSDFLGAIRAMTGGGTPVRACLLQIGGRLVYEVKVQVGGKVVTVRIDAATGAPR